MRRWRFSDARILRSSICASAPSAKSRASFPARFTRPIPDLQENIEPGGVLHELAAATGKALLFYCAFGERSAMAVQAAQDAGLASARHIEGGIGAWKNAGGPCEIHGPDR